ncbi:carboxypeptidase-like regulatory domain-containing protein [Methanohalophilus euhalobius]|uniref:Carboxypeptidase regulatory-like domain-containing protein n=1 Tax=Methanohalophilus euhalobius TaxID=51203 RepID=A0A314ZT37_9EURY|nr:carboxypeptidase-like regulatory domain-containing protein [Methanohalophilus euhalobius]PQV43025.1 nickel transport protein [Methanohalophilus euhalobius]RNI09396.1 carboxypeptidase regulatory-like domain-containing protein [Methanohalophilus euhalobius]
MNKRIINMLMLVLILAILATPAVSAHRVYLMHQVNEVEVKAWYGGGDPIANAEITIYAIKDGEEEIYIEDVTDEDGMYYFSPKLGVDEYRIIVSQMGHQDEIEIDLKGEGESAVENNSTDDMELPLTANIVAGIGYILGFAGIGLYARARKMQKE